ncbi:MAG: NAD+ synthase [Candidatus Limnocylindrus sp.]
MVRQLPPGVQVPDELLLDPGATLQICRSFIRAQFAATGASRAILGISGGIDSALVAHLLADALGPERIVGVIMPYATSAATSRADALQVVEKLGCAVEEVPITAAVDSMISALPDGGATTPIRRGNIAARARMTALYDRSALYRGLVAGTGNKTEYLIGYTTLHGDAACAFNPIGDLYKSQVRLLAAHLEVPEQIIAKAPSADLWPGQTDESEGGFDYPTLDRILLRLVDRRQSVAETASEGFDVSLVERVRGMILASEFKRLLPPIASIGTPNRSIDHLRSASAS